MHQYAPHKPAPPAPPRPPPPPADPTARRSRPVVRRPAGTSSITSVNDPRAHVGSTQRHRRLCQISEIPLSPYGMSRGAVDTYSSTDIDTTPQLGQPDADSAAVSTCTTRSPKSSRSMCLTRTPGSPNRIVVAWSKPVASLVRCVSNSKTSRGHGRLSSGAPHAGQNPTLPGQDRRASFVVSPVQRGGT